MEIVVICILSVVVLILSIAVISLLGQRHAVVNDPKTIEILTNKLKKSGDALKQSVDTNTPQ